MAKRNEERKIVNHRWHLPSLDDILDHALPRWADGHHPDFSGPDGYDRLRAALHRFAQDLMRQLSFSLEKAAAKGIEQALQLIRDPEYHKTVKRRTKRNRERHEQFMAKQQAERERYKRGELTLAEKLQAIGQVTYSIQYHEKELQKLRDEQKRLEMIMPKPRTVTMAAIDDQDDDDSDNEWPDRITFD